MEYYWTGEYGLELRLTEEQARGASHQGQCDDDVLALSQDPGIASQVAQWPADALRAELREYGAWDATELQDHSQNIQRMLWLAAGAVLDDPQVYAA